MILTLDIGNTNIKTALFEGMEMKQYWRISSDRDRLVGRVWHCTDEFAGAQWH